MHLLQQKNTDLMESVKNQKLKYNILYAEIKDESTKTILALKKWTSAILRIMMKVSGVQKKPILKMSESIKSPSCKWMNIKRIPWSLYFKRI